jgi:hypothetical protein
MRKNKVKNQQEIERIIVAKSRLWVPLSSMIDKS